MSLTELVKSGVETAFTAAGDLVGLGDYISSGDEVFDPVADSYTGQTTIPNVRMIKTTVKQEDLEVSSASVVDVKFLIPFKDLISVEPDTEDQILYQGILYNILNANKIPGDGLWIIFCRRA